MINGVPKHGLEISKITVSVCFMQVLVDNFNGEVVVFSKNITGWWF
jgi:hypothetical protein